MASIKNKSFGLCWNAPNSKYYKLLTLIILNISEMFSKTIKKF